MEILRARQDRRMGIRYYAYAFDADMTALALADPLSVISDDPLADAWGLPHGAQVAVTNFVQSVPKTDMLYLDKAWSSMQALTAPNGADEPPRPAYRMFEGQVAMDGYGWLPWARAIAPEEVAAIAEDLIELQDSVSDERATGSDESYVLDFLQRAVEFVTHVASSNRGFAYMIG